MVSSAQAYGAVLEKMVLFAGSARLQAQTPETKSTKNEGRHGESTLLQGGVEQNEWCSN